MAYIPAKAGKSSIRLPESEAAADRALRRGSAASGVLRKAAGLELDEPGVGLDPTRLEGEALQPQESRRKIVR